MNITTTAVSNDKKKAKYAGGLGTDGIMFKIRENTIGFKFIYKAAVLYFVLNKTEPSMHQWINCRQLVLSFQ